MVKCIKCGFSKEEKEFYPSYLKKWYYVCIHCSQLIAKKYSDGHKSKQKRNRKRWGEENKKRWKDLDPCLVPEPKECCHCKLLLERSKFDKLLSQTDGLQSWCKECQDLRHRNDPRYQMLRNARKKARDRGLNFNLSIYDIPIPPLCPILGIELRVSSDRIGPTDNSPSLDRIDNSKGYVRGNVHVISYRANSIKRDSSIEELQKIVDYLKALRKES